MASASNLFGAGRNSVFNKLDISLQNWESKDLNVLSPVPTAVPPYAKYLTSSIDFSNRFKQFSRDTLNPENSYERVTGVASWVCVLPILIMPENSDSFYLSDLMIFSKLGFN